MLDSSEEIREIKNRGDLIPGAFLFKSSHAMVLYVFCDYASAVYAGAT